MNAVDEVRLRDVYEYLTGFSTANASKATRHDFWVVCPFHEDTNPSMTLNPERNTWYCQVEGIGGGIADFVARMEPNGYYSPSSDPKARRSAAFAWLRDRNFARQDLVAMPTAKGRNSSGFVKLTNERWTEYDYVDAHGELRYKVIRIDGLNERGEPDKHFKQKRRLPDGGRWEETATHWVYVTPDGEAFAKVDLYKKDRTKRRKPAGPWVWNLDGVEHLLYRLPEVLAAAARGERIFVVEGEKKAENLRQRTGLCVTTWNNGANADLDVKWLRHVAGAKQIVVLGDSDPYKKQLVNKPNGDRVEELVSKGRDAALDRADFFRRVCLDVRAVDLFPDRNDGSDVDDWLTERPRATAEELVAELDAVVAATERV